MVFLLPGIGLRIGQHAERNPGCVNLVPLERPKTRHQEQRPPLREFRHGGAVLRQEKSARATQRVQRRHHLGKGRKGRDFRRALPVVAHKADAAGGRGQVGPPGPRRDQTERIALVQAAHGSARRIVKPEILYDPPDRVERPGALADHIVQALTAGADVLSACPGALVFSV